MAPQLRSRSKSQSISSEPWWQRTSSTTNMSPPVPAAVTAVDPRPAGPMKVTPTTPAAATAVEPRSAGPQTSTALPSHRISQPPIRLSKPSSRSTMNDPRTPTKSVKKFPPALAQAPFQQTSIASPDLMQPMQAYLFEHLPVRALVALRQSCKAMQYLVDASTGPQWAHAARGLGVAEELLPHEAQHGMPAQTVLRNQAEMILRIRNFQPRVTHRGELSATHADFRWLLHRPLAASLAASSADPIPVDSACSPKESRGPAHKGSYDGDGGGDNGPIGQQCQPTQLHLIIQGLHSCGESDDDCSLEVAPYRTHQASQLVIADAHSGTVTVLNEEDERKWQDIMAMNVHHPFECAAGAFLLIGLGKGANTTDGWQEYKQQLLLYRVGGIDGKSSDPDQISHHDMAALRSVTCMHVSIACHQVLPPHQHQVQCSRLYSDLSWALFEEHWMHTLHNTSS